MRRLVVLTGRIWISFCLSATVAQRKLHRVCTSGSHQDTSDLQLLETIQDLLDRGVKNGQFRRNIDPIDLYISISALTAHYSSNRYTFEAIFGKRS